MLVLVRVRRHDAIAAASRPCVSVRLRRPRSARLQLADHVLACAARMAGHQYAAIAVAQGQARVCIVVRRTTRGPAIAAALCALKCVRDRFGVHCAITRRNRAAAAMCQCAAAHARQVGQRWPGAGTVQVKAAEWRVAAVLATPPVLIMRSASCLLSQAPVRTGAALSRGRPRECGSIIATPPADSRRETPASPRCPIPSRYSASTARHRGRSPAPVARGTARTQ